MKIEIIPTGPFEVNCCVIEPAQGHVWIIDPGGDTADVVAALKTFSVAAPEAILLTHAHFDHVAGIEALQKLYPELPVYVDAKDEPALGNPLNQMPPEYPLSPIPRNLKNVAELDGRFGLKIIETPGHTPGGVCYYFAEAQTLFSGDTLFAGSCGRTDFYGGDFPTIQRSLQVLAKLPAPTRVIPGHGRETTIGFEIEHNPYIKEEK